MRIFGVRLKPFFGSRNSNASWNARLAPCIFDNINYMSFTLIIGPMKSGKSLELIGSTTPYKYANKKTLFVQPKINTRDKKVSSRAGVMAESTAVSSLHEIEAQFDVIGVDEIHMFSIEDATIVEAWILQGKKVFISGLDIDYRGQMFPIIQRLLELKPDVVIFKKAICDLCGRHSAYFSQITQNSKPVLSDLPSIIPEDGTYEYQARCRNCYQKYHQ